MLLVGDIGGTKTNLALYESDGSVNGESDPYRPITTQKYPSGDYESLEHIVAKFIAETGAHITHACFGLAGPVVEGKSELTNLSWTLSEAALKEAFDLTKVKLINDLTATASAVPILKDEDLYVLNEGHAVPEMSIAVIAPGTGLGEAYLTWDGDGNGRYVAHPSEGGHADFSPSNRFELGLLNYLYDHHDHVSTERVCSGKLGIPNIYNYLKHINYDREPDWLRRELAQAEDKTPIIINQAIKKPGEVPLCDKTLSTFVEILGAETGDLALTFLATGGVYLGGGIPPRIIPALKTDTFSQSFQQKGRFTAMMCNIPVKVILNANAALLGAAAVGLNLAKPSTE